MTDNDAFAPIDGLAVEYVDSAAGSRKSYTMVGVCVMRARENGTRIIYAVPTLELLRELAELARHDPPPALDPVPVYEISSRDDDERVQHGKPRRWSTTALLHFRITGRDDKDRPLNDQPLPGQGFMIFITHETLLRMTVCPPSAPDDRETFLKMARLGHGFWPPEAAEFELVIDEEPPILLADRLRKLHDHAWVLTSFLAVEPITVPLARRKRRQMQRQAREAGLEPFDDNKIEKAEKLLANRVNRAAIFKKILEDGAAKSSPGEVEQMERRIQIAESDIAALTAVLTELYAEKADGDKELLNAGLDAAVAWLYYIVYPRDPKWLRRAVRIEDWDDIYAYLQPLPRWLLSGASLFVDQESWLRLMAHDGYGPMRGQASISGFRRPEWLGQFRRVTIMSALFKHTYLFSIWEQLGVEFVPSSLVKLAVPTTPLGKRRLKLYWLIDQGWSKRLRDKSGGIEVIFRLIVKAEVLDFDDTVVVCTNKDDATEADAEVIHKHFGSNARLLPHNTRGQNRWRKVHQLVHTAALNSATPAIKWIESVLGIDSTAQRIGRVGQEIYQATMRPSLRDPLATNDVIVIMMDRDVCQWMAQWFVPADQVEIHEIDSSGVVHRKRSRTGRPPTGDRAMTNAERQRAYRLRQREQGEAP
jgi:hypothetical protein